MYGIIICREYLNLLWKNFHNHNITKWVDYTRYEYNWVIYFFIG